MGADRPRTPRPGPVASLLASVCVAGCSTPPPPPVQVAATPPASSEGADSAPLTPARWVDSGGSTLVGPTLAEGALVLLGGRRALIAKDGSAKVEAAPTPEGLLEVIEVPAPNGGRRLIGRGMHTIYRFDGPLGPAKAIARSESLIDHIGAGPGTVAIWDFQSYVPRFIDVETGEPKAMPNLPLLPVRALAFRNSKEGAAAFEAAGLATTTDGGATWRLAADTGPSRDALRVTGVRVHGDTLRAFVYSNGPDGPIDIANARLDRLVDPPVPANEPPLVRWIRVTERDPLEAAASTGIEAPGGGALIASHGLLARVDTKSGALFDLVEFSKGAGLAPCGAFRAGASAWLGCTVAEDGEAAEFADPFAVLRVPLGTPKLSVEKPAVRRSGEVELRASPSGGVMLLGPCSADRDGDVCTRQPDGSFASIVVRSDVLRSGAGPLADGRVAFLRGLEDGDEPTDEYDAPASEVSPEEAQEGEGTVRRRPYIVAVDRSGKERRIASLSIPDRPEAQLRVESPLEEDVDHTLRAILADDESVYALVQPPGREGASLAPITQAKHASIRAGRGLAIGDGRVMTSVDGGVTWVDAPLPERVRTALMGLGSSYFDEPGTFRVSEVGAKLDTQLRIGWGHADEQVDPKPGEASIKLGPRRQPPLAPEKTLTCVSAGAQQGTPPLASASELYQVFYKGKPPTAAKGRRVLYSGDATARSGLLETLAVLEEHGTDNRTDPPKTWTIRWMNPAEVSAKPRSWTGPAPSGSPWGASVRSAASSGGRALFSLRVGGKYLLLRVKASGAVETAEVSYELLPMADVAFGTDAGEPITWLHDSSVVVWISGEAPRTIASIGGRGTRTLGRPTKDGVPVLLSFSDLALMTTLPIPAAAKTPAAPKGVAGAKTAAASPPPVPISLDGWTSVANVVRREVTRLPVCGASPKGVRFVFAARQLNLRVDDAELRQPDAIYDVRVAQGEACVAAVSALAAASRVGVGSRPAGGAAPKPGTNPGKKNPPGGVKPGAATPGPVTFVRADFSSRKAEGGERGVPGSVYRMTCSLDK